MRDRLLSGVLAAVLSCSVASAQTNEAQSASEAVSQETKAAPVTDDRTIGDWRSFCVPNQKPIPCEMFQLVTDKARSMRVLMMSIGFNPAANLYRAEIIVPLGVDLAKGAKISVGSYASAILPFRNCNRDGCYADAIFDAAAINAMAAASTPGKVIVVLDEGKQVDLPLSLQGFRETVDVMSGNASVKISAPSP